MTELPLIGRVRILSAAVVLCGSLCLAAPAQAGYERSFESGSLIIPMDLAYQDHGIFQAYGLVFQLLRQGVTVYWVIDPEKTWHHAPCNEAGDVCAWDCAEEGSGVKCGYPTASPDFFVGAEVVWDGEGSLSPGDTISSHGYRGGPFIIDAAEVAEATAIIDIWNDPTTWGDNAWADRTEFNVVSVHAAEAAFDGYVRKEMVAAPTIAVFSDGNEDIATRYLRAAGIRQSNGNEFPVAKCGTCGPGTENPDMLEVVSIMGEMGTCDAPNLDHRNGALFTEDGNPAYCQIMSMHWGVNDRETVECDGGDCPATQAECAGETFTYHGHEVVAEVRQFLTFPTHFFAECQAVNAYENTVPNPQWPYLDDEDRIGHFLTTTGNPPDCPCSDGDFECVTGGCDDGARDCCLPRNNKELGAGFMIADQPDSNGLRFLNPEVPYNQLDGAFTTVGGSEPAYNLSSFLGTTYKNDLDVTFITGPAGPGDQDLWMTGFMDGECDIVSFDEFATPGECSLGKVSYLGGHRYATDVPISGNEDGQGARLFLNALFEADCVTTAGQPNVTLSWSGASFVAAEALPKEEAYTLHFSNLGVSVALDAVLTVTLPTGLEVTASDTGSMAAGDTLSWDLTSVGPMGGGASSGTRSFTVRFVTEGTHDFQAKIAYRAAASPKETAPVPYSVRIAPDSDGDGVPDDEDPAPNDASRCGDSDTDGCDDCSVAGTFDPTHDGCEGGLDAGGPGTPAEDDGGCGCRTAGKAQSRQSALGLLWVLGGALFARRRRRSTGSSM